jgi:hypothetical protein
MIVVSRMDMKHAEKDVEIAVGVMSALAVLLSAVEAWSWARRYDTHPSIFHDPKQDVLCMGRGRGGQIIQYTVDAVSPKCYPLHCLQSHVGNLNLCNVNQLKNHEIAI